MDYMLNREALTTSEVIYDGCQEQPVDLDISLPPDVLQAINLRLKVSIQ